MVLQLMKESKKFVEKGKKERLHTALEQKEQTKKLDLSANTVAVVEVD